MRQILSQYHGPNGITHLEVSETGDDHDIVEFVVPTARLSEAFELLGTDMALLEIEAIVWNK